MDFKLNVPQQTYRVLVSRRMQYFRVLLFAEMVSSIKLAWPSFYKMFPNRKNSFFQAQRQFWVSKTSGLDLFCAKWPHGFEPSPEDTKALLIQGPYVSILHTTSYIGSKWTNSWKKDTWSLARTQNWWLSSAVFVCFLYTPSR